MQALTDRQKQLLEAIYHSIRNEGYPPSFDELREALHISSNQAILDHLQALEKKGAIKREEKSARSINITQLGYKMLHKPPLIPLLGSARAGAFTPTFELAGQWQEVSNEIVRYQANVYIIKVNGDSMINAGIEDGSTLLIQQAKEFSSGEIVVASTDEGQTVKRFISQDSPPYMYLKPENPNYSIILFKDEVELQGKVIAKLDSNQWRSFKQGKLL